MDRADVADRLLPGRDVSRKCSIAHRLVGSEHDRQVAGVRQELRDEHRRLATYPGREGHFESDTAKVPLESLVRPRSSRDDRDDGGAFPDVASLDERIDAVHHLRDVNPLQEDAVLCVKVADEPIELWSSTGEPPKVKGVLDSPVPGVKAKSSAL